MDIQDLHNHAIDLMDEIFTIIEKEEQQGKSLDELAVHQKAIDILAHRLAIAEHVLRRYSLERAYYLLLEEFRYN